MKKVNLLFFFIIATLFIACDEENSTEHFNLRTEYEKDWGEVIVEPDKKFYAAGEKVQLTARAKEGFKFLGWKGSQTGTDSVLIITMNQDQNIEAVLIPNEGMDSSRCSLEVDFDSTMGNIEISPELISYEKGEEVTLTAKPKEGYSFKEWKGTTSGTKESITITMEKDHNINAVFCNNDVTADEFSLNIDFDSIKGNVEVSPLKTVYKKGEVVTLTATSKPGFEFLKWSGTVSGSDSVLEVTMNNQIDVTAVFQKINGGNSGTAKLEMSGEYDESTGKWNFNALLINEADMSEISDAEIKVDGHVLNVQDNVYSVYFNKPDLETTFNIEVKHNLTGTQNYEVTITGFTKSIEAALSADKQNVTLSWEDINANYYEVKRRLLRGANDPVGGFSLSLDKSHVGNSKTYDYKKVTTIGRPKLDDQFTHVWLWVKPFFVAKNLNNLSSKSSITVQGKSSELLKHEIVR